MTHNQFSGRKLAPSPRLQISPYTDRRRRRRQPGPAATVLARVIFSGIISGHQTTEPGRWLTPSRIASLSWQADWTALEGWPLRLIVSWDPTGPTLAAQLEADYGAGYNAIDFVTATSYTGSQPYDSGPIPWTVNTGSLELAVQGFWQP